MCGIAGYVSAEKENKIEIIVNDMLDTIKHRGPDGCGVKSFGDKVCLGHRRLAILDLSSDGLQPMCLNNRYWITYNGEIYNYLELKAELKQSGFSFHTQTDTEVLLAAYEKWGEDCVSRFNGMWAFAIYDSLKNTIFCSRDRYGVKPFYYEIRDDRFAFGSEIKEILTVKKGEVIHAERDVLSAFLTNGILDSDERTMFAGIEQLLGGDNLVFDCNTFTLKKYTWFDLTKVRLNRNSKEENYRLFNEKFHRAIEYRLRSDVSVGSCLSGGLDSSSIVCAVHNQLEKQGKETAQYTVSSCFEDKRYDEQEYIDAVVNKTGVVSYKVFPDMGAVFADLEKIIWHMDEPFGGTSIFAQWNVFKLAKENGLTVMLDGQGSDEQLAGYTPFYKVLFLDLLKRGKYKQLRREIKAYKDMRASSEPEPTWEIIASTILTAFFPDRLRFALNKLFRKRNVGMPFPASFYNNQIVKNSWKWYDKKNPQKYINAGLHQGMRALLHYEDRDSMAHSIESRVPFLDYELTEFIYSVPIEQKIENGRTKNLIREGLKDILPSEIYNRYSKLGFVTPEDQWLKDNEGLFFEELSKACDELAGFLDKKQVLDWYVKNVQKTRMGDSTCFRIICAAKWVQIFGVVV